MNVPRSFSFTAFRSMISDGRESVVTAIIKESTTPRSAPFDSSASMNRYDRAVEYGILSRDLYRANADTLSLPYARLLTNLAAFHSNFENHEECIALLAFYRIEFYAISITYDKGKHAAHGQRSARRHGTTLYE